MTLLKAKTSKKSPMLIGKTKGNTKKPSVSKNTPKSKKKPVSSPVAVSGVIQAINKEFGENAITLGVPKDSYKQIYIPTGVLQLDADLNGGIAVGRYTEVSGAYSTTKTTLCLHVLGEAQRMGMTCALIDVEGTSGDRDYLEACGIDVDKLFYSRPSSLDELLRIMLKLQRGGEVNFCLYDSVAASLATLLEQDTEVGDSMRMGVPQSELGSFFRQFQMGNNKFYRERKLPFTLLGVNQLREKIGAYGDPEYTPGGRAKGFYSTCELRLYRGDWIKEGGKSGKVVGQVVKYKVEKNKLGARMRYGEIDFYNDDNSAGVPKLNYDIFKDMVMVGISLEVIEKSGSWYSFEDLTKIQGTEALVDALRDREDLQESLRKKVLALTNRRAG